MKKDVNNYTRQNGSVGLRKELIDAFTLFLDEIEKMIKLKRPGYLIS